MFFQRRSEPEKMYSWTKLDGVQKQKKAKLWLMGIDVVWDYGDNVAERDRVFEAMKHSEGISPKTFE